MKAAPSFVASVLVPLAMASTLAGCGVQRPDSSIGESIKAAPDESSSDLIVHQSHVPLEGAEPGKVTLALTRPDRIAVTTFSSAECPVVPTGVKISRPRLVVIELQDDESPDETCTTDLAPTTSVMEVSQKALSQEGAIRAKVHHPRLGWVKLPVPRTHR
jgi:hypothetical protein